MSSSSILLIELIAIPSINYGRDARLSSDSFDRSLLLGFCVARSSRLVDAVWPHCMREAKCSVAFNRMPYISW